jgi:hypothetical protein
MFSLLLGLLFAGGLLSGCTSDDSLGRSTPTGVWGYVASENDAAFDIDERRSSVSSLIARRVAAPADGFIVATVDRGDSGPAMQVGLVPVKRGESRDVIIPILGARSSEVTLTLYIDRAHKGLLEFDPMDPTSSPDRPVFVRGKPVQRRVAISQAAAPMGAGAAVLDVYNQPAASTVNVTHVVSSAPSWVVVYSDENGGPGEVLGMTRIGATDEIGLEVDLKGPVATRGVFVALHADTGRSGVFEYNRSRPTTNMPDPPYLAGGAEVMKRIELQ